MILARIKLLGLSSESDKTFQVKMHDVCILDIRELSVELPQGFHERLVTRLANAAHLKIK
jgi:hypothetical protein